MMTSLRSVSIAAAVCCLGCPRPSGVTTRVTAPSTAPATRAWSTAPAAGTSAAVSWLEDPTTHMVLLEPSAPAPGEDRRWLGPLAGKAILFVHLSGPVAGGIVHTAPGDLLGTIADRPIPESHRFQSVFDEADASYAAGDYAISVAMLVTVVDKEPDNPFLLDRLGRSLFWIEDEKSRRWALGIYRKLVGILDRSVPAPADTVVIDLWFREAYWKLASLYLDAHEWNLAIFELTRSMMTGITAEPALRDQALCFLLEANLELRDEGQSRYFYAAAMDANPDNECVKALVAKTPVL